MSKSSSFFLMVVRSRAQNAKRAGIGLIGVTIDSLRYNRPPPSDERVSNRVIPRLRLVFDPD